MKRRITISIDENLYKHFGLGARNASEFINQLLKDKTRLDNYELLRKRLFGDLLKNPDFLGELRLSLESTKPKKDNVEYTEDWGA